MQEQPKGEGREPEPGESMRAAQRRFQQVIVIYGLTGLAMGGVSTWLAIRYDLSIAAAVGVTVLCIVGTFALATWLMVLGFRD